MPSRPWDWNIIASQDGKSCHRNRPGAPVRPDGGHGSHSGARGTTWPRSYRRCLPGSRGGILFPKGGSLEEGRIYGRGSRLQLLSWKEPGRLWGGGSSDDERFNTCGKDSYAARPWPTSKISARNRGIQRQTGCNPGGDFAGQAQALTTMEPKSAHDCPPIRRVVSIAP